MEVIRNMWRRKLRTSLTTLGIAVGILAFVVLGAMAEKMNFLVEGGIKYLTGQIGVTIKSSNIAGLLPAKKVKELRAVEGIDKVQPAVNMLFDDLSMVSFGMPLMIVGPDLSVPFENRNYPELEMREGRMVTEKDRWKTALGIDVAAAKKAEMGDEIKIRGKRFKVIGILEKTLTGPDKMAYVNLKDAQTLLIDQDPFLRELKKKNPKAKEVTDLYTDASVSWKNGFNPEKVAKRIEKEVADVKTTSPKKSKEEFVRFSAIFNLVTVGSALLALIVGGMSVINTMIMSVTERTREIGIKKAIGAKTRHILREYLVESALIGLIGGLLGLGLGNLLVNALNAQASAGNEVFLLTGRLAVGALLFATSLGIFAGIYPAWHAARLNPVTALKAD